MMSEEKGCSCCILFINQRWKIVAQNLAVEVDWNLAYALNMAVILVLLFKE